MDTSDTWTKAWGLWKILLTVGALAVLAAALVLYFEGGLLPLVVVSVIAVTVVLYRKASSAA